jgi:hypothetical protein
MTEVKEEDNIIVKWAQEDVKTLYNLLNNNNNNNNNRDVIISHRTDAKFILLVVNHDK